MAWIIICAIMLMIATLLIAPRWEDPALDLEIQITKLTDFRFAHRFDQVDKALSLLLDPQSEQFAVVKVGLPISIYSFERLSSVVAQRDGAPLKTFTWASSTIRTNGGGYLRPLGLSFGGLHALTQNNEPIRRLTLQIYIAGFPSPAHEIFFFSHQRGMAIDSHGVLLAAIELDEWYGRFLAILNGRVPV